MVPAPSFFTFASQDVRMLSSRSVAVMVRRLPFASTRRFDKMGIVDLRSTPPCVRFSSSSRSDLFTLNSISGDPRVVCRSFAPLRLLLYCLIYKLKVYKKTVAVAAYVDSAKNGLTRIIRAGYGRVHPVEIFAVRMKTATETLRPANFHSACTGRSKNKPSFAAISNRKRRVAC